MQPEPEITFLDKRDRRTASMAIAAVALLGLGFVSRAFVEDAKASVSRDLAASMDRLSSRLDAFNTRLSRLEGAFDGDRK